MKTLRAGFAAAVLVLTLCVGTASAAVAFVQIKDSGVDFSGSTTLAVSLTSAAGAGNCLAIGIGSGSQTVTISSIAGNSNTYTLVDGPVDEATTERAWTYYAKNINSGATTITVTFSAAPSATRLLVHEISGCDTTAPLDQHVINPQTIAGGGGAANSYTSTAKTTTVNGEYIFGFHINDNSDSEVAGTGYTMRTAAAHDPVSEDQIQSTAGSIAATFSPAAGAAQFNGSLTAMMTFKPSGGGGGGTPCVHGMLGVFSCEQ